MPYPNEHSARLRAPGGFSKKAWRRTKGGTIYGRIKVPSAIGIIWGKLTGRDKPSDPPIPQALRFPISSWGRSSERAKQWLRGKNIKYIKFETASPKKSESASAQESIDLKPEQLAFRVNGMEIVINKLGGNVNAD